jgi:hypothetical protein
MNGGTVPDIPMRCDVKRFRCCENSALADSYAALTDARPFRPAMTEEAARRELIDRAGIEFDPAVVAYFFHLNRFSGAGIVCRD